MARENETSIDTTTDLVREGLKEAKLKRSLVSIVILVHNNIDFIENCIKSVLETNYENIEVVIVDNASKDGSSQYLRKKIGQQKKVKIIYNEVNLGFAEGNNIGAKEAKGKYLTFLNIDTIVAPDWMNAIVGTMDLDYSIGACQSKLLQMNNPEFFDSAGDFIDKYGVMMRRGGDLSEKDKGQYDKIEEIFSARGAALTIRKALFERIGGFDASYFLIYDDIDLCWRTRLYGYRVVFIPKSVVYHYGGFSLSPKRVFFSTRNWLTTIAKNYDLSNLLKKVPQAIAIICCAALAEVLLKRKPIQSSERMKGLVWVIFNFKLIWTKRLKVQSQIRKVGDSEVMTRMLDSNLAILHWRHVWL
jgi:GT2 family glycosyltransferase